MPNEDFTGLALRYSDLVEEHHDDLQRDRFAKVEGFASQILSGEDVSDGESVPADEHKWLCRELLKREMLLYRSADPENTVKAPARHDEE